MHLALTPSLDVLSYGRYRTLDSDVLHGLIERPWQAWRQSGGEVKRLIGAGKQTLGGWAAV